MKKFIKRLFCSHLWFPMDRRYANLGWSKCHKCGKEKYSSKNLQFTHFKL